MVKSWNSYDDSVLMLRTLLQSDLEQLLLIEQAVHVMPWTAETFEICFRAGFMGWVIEIEEKVRGFIIISLNGDECHILNLCVERAHQRQGLGRKLLTHALDYARSKGSELAYLEVRRSNVSAISLYTHMNFQLIGKRKGYYPIHNGMEDAFIFAIKLHERTS